MLKFPFKIQLIVLSVLLLMVIAVASGKEWWQTAAFYQIYPRSFKDSDNNGIGDLKGITEKLPYLKEIGVTGFWMSPIFASPMVDFGYDISDYRKIHEDYGTMEDFEVLVKRAHELGLKVILDFVPNHSSDQHEWFQKSINKVDGYEDYYIWDDGKDNPSDPMNRLPPSNWLSAFRGSAWKWNTKRQQFYLHQFHEKQPDLNYRNPKVVAEMKDTLKFWLDKGVDGFRIDAVTNLFEAQKDKTGFYPDEPPSHATDDPDDEKYLNHIHTHDQDENFDMVYQWREFMDNYQKVNGGETRVFMTETDAEISVLMRYYGNDTVNGAHFPFNFKLLFRISNSSTATDFKETTDLWMHNMKPKNTANWVIGNHDRQRVGSRLGENKIDSMHVIILTLPGISVTYNGEEIGMTDVPISFADTIDPLGCNAGPELYEQWSRDPVRTPFQWDDSKNAGFSLADKTWLPVSPKYADVNVKKQTATDRSHLKVYKNLMKLRQTDTLKNGNYSAINVNNDVFVIVRQLDKSDTYLTVVNLAGSERNVDLTKVSDSTYSVENVECEIAGISSSRNKGDKISTKKLVLQPMESLVLKVPAQNSASISTSIKSVWILVGLVSTIAAWRIV
uniref:alpha-glucosidase n=1 Tax=Corethrella appendiculata TaxID=1370023 RepID=U5ELE7_9DIPT